MSAHFVRITGVFYRAAGAGKQNVSCFFITPLARFMETETVNWQTG